MLEHGLFLTPTGVRRTLCNWPQLRSIYSNTCCKFRRLLSLTEVNIPQLGSIHPNRDQNTQPPVCLWLSDSETRFRYLKWIWTFQKYWKYLRPRLVFLKNLKISRETSWFSCHLQAGRQTPALNSVHPRCSSFSSLPTPCPSPGSSGTSKNFQCWLFRNFPIWKSKFHF